MDDSEMDYEELGAAVAHELVADETQAPDCRTTAASLAIGNSSRALHADLTALLDVARSAGNTFSDRLQRVYHHNISAEIRKELDAMYTKGSEFKDKAMFKPGAPLTASTEVQRVAQDVKTHSKSARDKLEVERCRQWMILQPGMQNQFEALHGVVYCLAQIDSLVKSALDRRNEILRAEMLLSQQQVKYL